MGNMLNEQLAFILQKILEIRQYPSHLNFFWFSGQQATI